MPIERLSHSETTTAIAALLHRVKHIEAASGDRFPLYRLADRPWVLSTGGSWMGGFWAGIGWMRAFKTSLAPDRDRAIKIGRRLETKLDSDTLQRSLIFNYGAGLGCRLLGEPMAKKLYQQAGRAVADSYRTELGFVPLGREMGGGALGGQILSIDPLGATLSLLHATGYPEQARRQMSVAVKACYAQDGRWFAQACYQSGRFSHQRTEGDWARGQAWAMLALMQAVHLLGKDYLPIAQRSVEYWLTQYSHDLPANRLSQPEGERDPCASVIASIAMMGLARLMPNADWLETHALRQLLRVIYSRYFDDGQFVGHCYRISDHEERCVESPCGIFFLLAALMVADKQIEPLWL